MMIEHRFLGTEFAVPTCLHGGPMPLSALQSPDRRTPFEEQFDLPGGSHSRALRQLATLYGATGIVAIDGEAIVGLARYCPRGVRHLLGGYLCTQEEEGARRLAELDTSELPSFDSFQPKALQLDCLQVCGDSQGQGIGRSMLERTIAWAKSYGWEELYSSAVDHIFPIMAWSGHLSDVALKKRGFTVIEKVEDEGGIAEAATHMRQGGHGKEVQETWEKHYAHISEGHTFHRYTMRLGLRGTASVDGQS